MNRQRTLAISATLAAAVAIGTFFNTGTMPAAPEGGVCTVSWAVGPCEAAIAFSAGDVVCEFGTLVTMPVEVVATGSEEAPEGLPSTFIPVEESTTVVDCASLTRPAKALTVVPVAKYGVTVPNGTVCPPIAIAGYVPAGCE